MPLLGGIHYFLDPSFDRVHMSTSLFYLKIITHVSYSCKINIKQFHYRLSK